ncbi:hypothetical protein [Kitasatospora terrestris]|uniref:hypothetical protein n=1 Tax=Kitasatospora terrestris TaxID=258051 RepID=UPI0031EE286A
MSSFEPWTSVAERSLSEYTNHDRSAGHQLTGNEHGKPAEPIPSRNGTASPSGPRRSSTASPMFSNGDCAQKHPVSRPSGLNRARISIKPVKLSRSGATVSGLVIPSVGMPSKTLVESV